jgi:hypothetical protein
MKQLSEALAAVRAASDALAVHSGRGHDECEVCADIGVQLIAAEEAIERALAEAFPARAPHTRSLLTAH